MKAGITTNEFVDVANFFCSDNAQTLFLLRRMKAHDVYIYEHALKAAYYTLLLAQGLGLSGQEQERMYRSALLMDIGKLRISYKPREGSSAETEEDSANILLHPLYSWELLEDLIGRQLVDGEAILQHHENLDGTGYPNSRSWEDISLQGRVLRVADSFASMVAFDRRSRTMEGVEQALDEMYRWSNIMYDSDLVALLFHCFREAVSGESRETAGKKSRDRGRLSR